jgi:starch phosphorylase
MVRSGYFSPEEPNRFAGLIDGLLNGGDYFMVLADFAAYVACQDRVDQTYHDSSDWARRAIVNIAGMPRFSSDRTIREYAEDIWGISRVRPVTNSNWAA